jgi:hypothetical protein
MNQPITQKKSRRSRSVLAALPALFALSFCVTPAVSAASGEIATLEQRVTDLKRELAEAERDLDAALAAEAMPDVQAKPVSAEISAAEEEVSDDIRFGPVTVGGAMRVNYILGDYEGGSPGPSRGSDGGNFELDTFRVNMSLDQGPLIGKLEYRWYNGYNFIHTGWVGYQFDDGSQLQAGVTRVPFGAGPYGVSQSWFFDQHYYVGLSDDADLGFRYVTERGNWNLDFAYFVSSEGDWNGASNDSARYGYDAVKWRSGLDENGNVVAAPVNGYSERNQFNARIVHGFRDSAISTDLGLSLQYGQLDGRRVDDGHHWAASAHMVNQFGNIKLASQITRYAFDIDDDNPLGTDELVPMGAYDFAWPVAADAWLPAVSLSYTYNTPHIGWLDYIVPYVEYSNIVKTEDDFNDSALVTLGAAWANRGWYLYSELAYSNGNYFVGDEGDDYVNLFEGVGDFGVNGNDRWNYRLNINFGYYF